MNKHAKIKFNNISSAAVIFVLSAVILLSELFLTSCGFSSAFTSITGQRGLLLLNFFPVAAAMCFFYLLLGNAFFASAVCEFVFAGLSYANMLKIEGREDVFTPGDIFLIKEALGAVRDYSLNIHPARIAAIILLIGFFVLCGCFSSFPKSSKKSKIVRMLLICLVFVLCVSFVYKDKDIYYRFEVDEVYNVPLEYNTYGFNYCFLYNYNLYPVDKPAGFSREEAAGWNTVSDASPQIKPNILFVMCEAFSDLSAEEMFDYAEDENPLREYYEVTQSDRALSGHIIVSNYAAGTANTEFNVLTGMQTNSIGEGLTSSFRIVNKATDNIFTVLEKDGYNGLFVHPGTAWFYNRSSVYKYFGIDDQVFSEAFDASDFKGNMVSDAAFFDELTSDFSDRMKADDPVFAYSVTIQNHQSYLYSKYPFPPGAVPLKTEVSDAAREALEVYMEGIRDSSHLAKSLSEYVDSVDEPVILVFFGDHRPNLGNTYNELGMSFAAADDYDGRLSMYEVPFVIYVNESFSEYADFASLQLSSEPVISDNYLGAMVLELAGYGKNDAYFDALNSLRRTVPVYRLNEADDPNAGLEIMDKLRKWTYYRIRY